MGNGGNWLVHIDSTKREEILQQIESWPYVILVDEGNDAGLAIDPYVIAHACVPMSDQSLAEVAKTGRDLTLEEISICVWSKHTPTKATPVSTAIPAIQGHGRDHMSIRAYLGHCSLEAAEAVYAQINAFCIDPNAVHVGALIVANHTRNTFELIGKTIYKEVTDDLTYLRRQAKRRPTFRCSSAPATAVGQASPSIGSTSIKAPSFSAKTLDESIMQNIHLRYSNGGSVVPAESRKAAKDEYLAALASQGLSDINKQKMAFYLLQISQTHLLAKEKKGDAFSHQTESMHHAISFLLNGSDSVQKTCLKTKVQRDDEIVTFSRHRGYFK